MCINLFWLTLRACPHGSNPTALLPPPRDVVCCGTWKYEGAHENTQVASLQGTGPGGMVHSQEWSKLQTRLFDKYLPSNAPIFLLYLFMFLFTHELGANVVGHVDCRTPMGRAKGGKYGETRFLLCKHALIMAYGLKSRA